MKKKVRLLLDGHFAEISAVDRPACDLATVQSVQLAKRSEQMDLNPEALKAIGVTEQEAGPIKKFFAWLFSKESAGESAGSEGHGGYLVTDSDGQKHLPTSRNGKRDHKLMGAAWAALHGGYRGKKYEGPDKDKAIARLKRMYEAEGMKTPSEKAAGTEGLQKSLYDVGDLASIVQRLDYMAQSAQSEKDYEGDESTMPGLLTALRDQAGKLLIQMAEEEVGELKMATPEDINKVAETILGKMRESQNVEKKGAKMSASNRDALAKAKKHFAAAGDYFGKAAKAMPDNEDISGGLDHHEMGMMHLSKLDAGPDSVSGDVGDASVGNADSPAKADQPADFTKALDSLKTELKGEFQKQLDEITKKNHELEIENAVLKTKLETVAQMPAPAKAKVGLPVFKTQHQEDLVRAASRDGRVTEIDISKIDSKDPEAFRKALTATMSKPQPVTREMMSRLGGAGA